MKTYACLRMSAALLATAVSSPGQPVVTKEPAGTMFRSNGQWPYIYAGHLLVQADHRILVNGDFRSLNGTHFP